MLDRLGVQTRGQRLVEFVDGRIEAVDITEPLLFELLGRDTPDEAFVLGNEVLIGQTVLENLDLLSECARQRVVPAHPEGPISKVK